MKTIHKEVLIVGGGLAGLTAAAYISKSGHSAVILEKTQACGGVLNSFTRNGYLFDTGARSIENSGIIRPMVKDLGIELELLSSPVTIGVESYSVHMESKESIDTYGQMLETLYPENVQEIQNIIQRIKSIFTEMKVIYGTDNPVFRNYKKDRKYLFTELLPWVGRFLLAVYRMEKRGEPIESYLKNISLHQSLNDIIDQHFFKNTPASFALGYFYVYLDYLYPKGGTGKLPEALVQKILEQGGEILTHTEIVAVDSVQKRIQDSNGNYYTYDTLLWCADLKTLYRNLDTSQLEESVTSRATTICTGRGGDSVFTLFLGVDTPPEAFGKRTNGHLFYTPSRQGLGETHISELKELLDTGDSVSKEELFAWVSKYCALTSYEISIPSLRDKSLSPKGKTGLIVSFLFDYHLMKLVEKTPWYEEFIVHVETMMIKTLRETVFHDLLNTIELQFSASPLSIEKRFGTSEGGITGWTFEQPSPAVHKLLQISKAVKTPIPDVYQAGQWTYTPGGIPIAILTGWYASETIRSSITQKKHAKS